MRFPLALASLALLAGVAHGGRTVHRVGLNAVSTGWGTSYNPIAVPRHDPALGTLQSVTVCFRGVIARRFRVESLGAQPSTVLLTDLSTAMVWRRPCDPTQVPDVRRIVFSDVQLALGAFDGALDWAGSSGADTQAILHGFHPTESVLTAPGDLACFVGAGAATIPVELSFRTHVVGPGNLALESQASATLSGVVIYEWL